MTKGKILFSGDYGALSATGDAEGTVRSRATYWHPEPVGPVTRLSLRFEREDVYDLNEGESRILFTQNVVDEFGNVTSRLTSGGTLTSDAIQTTTTYASPISGSEVYDKPKETYSDYCDPVTGNWKRFVHKQFIYDAKTLGQVDQGNVTKVTSFDGASGSVFSEMTYDSYGNILVVKDERGFPITTVYDAYHLYPAKETNALGHEMLTEMDYRWGKPKKKTDPNLAATEYEYDEAGRIKCVAQPGDSIQNCTNPTSTAATERYEYHFAPQVDPPDAELSWVKVERREPNQSSGYLPTTTFIDALGRHRYSETLRQVDGQSQTIIVGDTEYDAGGRVVEQYDPYPAPQGEGARNNGVNIFDYHLNGSAYIDPLNRPHTVTKTDGEVVETLYDRGKMTSFDELGNKAVTIVDRYDRVIRSEVYNGPSTLYSWATTTYDGGGRVLSTTLNGNQNTKVSHTYDWLGRKTQTVDPDSGTWKYAYDATGNLIFQDDPKTGQHIEFCYDALGRVTKKSYFDDNDTQQGTCQGSSNIQYIYDAFEAAPTGNKGRGRLTPMPVS